MRLLRETGKEARLLGQGILKTEIRKQAAVTPDGGGCLFFVDEGCETIPPAEKGSVGEKRGSPVSGFETASQVGGIKAPLLHVAPHGIVAFLSEDHIGEGPVGLLVMQMKACLHIAEAVMPLLRIELAGEAKGVHEIVRKTVPKEAQAVFIEKVDIEVDVVADHHGGADKVHKSGKNNLDGSGVLHHAVADPGEGCDKGADRHGRPDQGRKTVYGLMTGDPDRADLDDAVIFRIQTGCFQIEQHIIAGQFKQTQTFLRSAGVRGHDAGFLFMDCGRKTAAAAIIVR